MAVKITQYGIDTVQDNTVSSSKIVDNSITYEDLPSGSVVQVINTIYYSQTSYTITTSDTVHPGTTITITPKLSGSYFMIYVRQFIEVDNSWNVVWNIQRNGTRINIDNSSNSSYGIMMAAQSYGATTNNSSTPEHLDISTLDVTGSTAGVPITYRLCGVSDANKACYVNRCFGTDEYGSSEVIIMEIKG